MKKLFVAMMGLLAFTGATYAQKTIPTTVTPSKTKTITAVNKQQPVKAATLNTTAHVVSQPPKATTTTVAKTNVAKPAIAKTSTPLKANGTPDMRYKANKTVPAGPLKKDGTPDLRYKANKAKN
jgi:hypothetical protein